MDVIGASVADLRAGLAHVSGYVLSSSGRNVFNVDRNKGTVMVSV